MRRIWKKLLLGLAIFALVVGSYYFFQVLGGQRELEREIRLARGAGMPLNPSDMKAFEPSRDENAADTYAATIPRFQSASRLQVAISAKRADAVRAEFAKSGLEPLIRNATSKPHYQPPLDWGLGAAVFDRYNSPIKQMAKMLVLAAVSEADAKDLNMALVRLGQARQISRHLAEPRTQIHQIISMSTEAYVGSGVMHMLRRFSDDENALKKLQAFVDSYGPIPDQRTYLGGELVLTGATVRELVKTPASALSGYLTIGEDTTSDTFLAYKTKLPGFIPRMHAQVIREYRLLWTDLSAAPNDLRVMRQAFASSRKRVREMKGDGARVASLLLPNAWGSMYDPLGRFEARRRVQRTAVRVLLQRLSSGKLPEKLPDYGEMSTDPFGSNALRYKRTQKGFLLYSVGQDHVDNGGDRKLDSGIFAWPDRPSETPVIGS